MGQATDPLLRIMLCVMMAASPLYADNWKPSDGYVCHSPTNAWVAFLTAGLTHCHATAEQREEKMKQIREERLKQERLKQERLKQEAQKAKEAERQDAIIGAAVLTLTVLWLAIKDQKEREKPQKVFLTPEENRLGIRINYSLP